MYRHTDRIKTAYLKALAHPARLRILELLCRKEYSVGQLIRPLDSDQPTVSRHLSVLKHAGFTSSRQKGPLIFYRVQNRKIKIFLKKLTALLKQKLQTDRRFLKKSDG